MAHRSLATLIVVLALAAAGCGGGGYGDEEVTTSAEPDATTPGASTGQTATSEDPPTMKVRLYYLDGEKIRVYGEEVPETEGVAAAALRALLENAEDRPTEIPEATELNGVSIDGETATVDLSHEFESGGGSLSMTARAAQVVFTLTQFASVRIVDFELDGEPVESLGGEGVGLVGVTRADFEEVTPQILVEAPLPGESTPVPVTVSGSANTFEANLLLRIEGPDGAKLIEEHTTATSGSGVRGTFETTLAVSVDKVTEATLVAFEPSANDGSETHVYRVPLRLCPSGATTGC